MADFIRARSQENKEIRLLEIENAAETLLKESNYHKITFAAIAEKLGWSRANLYKYAASKEEIFLEILTDKYILFTDSLLSAFPPSSDYSLETMSEVWAAIITSHQDYLTYQSIQTMILETNVSLEKLAKFKQIISMYTEEVISHFSDYLHLSSTDTASVFSMILFHAIGLNHQCQQNPFSMEAARLAEISEQNINFKKEMQNFILMCLKHYTKNN